jgi:TatD DNase family protein
MDLPGLVDTHCHLSNARFAADLPAVLGAAQAAGVRRCVCIATGLADAVAVAGLRSSQVATAVGLDPFSVHACTDLPGELARLAALLETGGWCAVGECGIECHHDLDPLSRQIEAFAAQTGLARRLGLPLVIHARRGKHGDAHAIAADVVAAHPGVRGVVHSFDGDAATARRWLDLGFHLSVNGMLTYKGNDALRAAMAAAPADRILIETDAPYLAPVPLRGRRNEPAFVVHTAALLADLRGMRSDDLAAWTTRNADALFSRA